MSEAKSGRHSDRILVVGYHRQSSAFGGVLCGLTAVHRLTGPGSKMKKGGGI